MDSAEEGISLPQIGNFYRTVRQKMAQMLSGDGGMTVMPQEFLGAADFVEVAEKIPFCPELCGESGELLQHGQILLRMHGIVSRPDVGETEIDFAEFRIVPEAVVPHVHGHQNISGGRTDFVAALGVRLSPRTDVTAVEDADGEIAFPNLVAVAHPDYVFRTQTGRVEHRIGNVRRNIPADGRVPQGVHQRQTHMIRMGMSDEDKGNRSKIGGEGVPYPQKIGFPADLILYLYEYCASRDKKNPAYIEAVALSWAEQGIRTGVISNISYCPQAVKKRIEELLPHNRFEFIMATSAYMFRKPNRRIFELALEKAGLEPGEVWYVGDSYECDVQGARNAGLFPVWYTGASEAPEPSDDGVLRINEWSELEEYISACEQ